jgi:hypothetical protein
MTVNPRFYGRTKNIEIDFQLFVNEWHNGNLRFGSSPLLIKLQMGL